MTTKEKLHRTYSEEEIQELEKWFKEQQLPASLIIDKSTSIPNLKETLVSLFEQAYICRENPKMLGAIRLIEKIKSKLDGVE
ncbi:MAG: DUF6965 family protein [Phocaeicola sp.]